MSVKIGLPVKRSEGSAGLARDWRRRGNCVQNEHMAQIKDDGERMIPAYHSGTLIYAEHISRYRFAAQFVAGKRVLDVASGTGYGSELLKQAGATGGDRRGLCPGGRSVFVGRALRRASGLRARRRYTPAARRPFVRRHRFVRDAGTRAGAGRDAGRAAPRAERGRPHRRLHAEQGRVPGRQPVPHSRAHVRGVPAEP